jgi:hypothetical protein
VRRALVAVACGALALLAVALSLGLPGAPVGAGDNGDGSRLYCGAGLAPRTPDGRSNWKGGVVIAFATDAPACSDPIVSSALPVLRLATVGSGATFSLTRLGLLYAAAVGAGTAVAAWAVGPRTRLLALGPALVPLLGPTFTRFFVSTFSEPAGLLGACLLVLGASAIAVTARTERPARAAGLLLVAVGGLVAATAKASYLPLLVVALAVCAGTAVSVGDRARRGRLVGLATAAALALAAAAPVVAGLAWQQRHFAAVNTHNLVFTTVLPEVGATATGPLGEPPTATAAAGRAYYPAGPDGVPGSDVVAADPAAVRAAAYRVLLTHPAAAVDALGLGFTATLGARLDYLPSAALGASSVAPALGTTVGEQGAYGEQLRAWLAGLALPWLPALVAAGGVLLGALTLRRGTPLVRALGRIAALGALSAVGLVAAAVLGDGYFEIAKHVWLAAYLLEVTAVAAVLAGLVAAGRRLVRRLRSA